MNREELIEEAERGNREREAREHRSLFAAAERSRLIEEAATAILTANDVHPDDPDGDHGYYAQTWRYAAQDAEAALTVFEQAHTPTDDERFLISAVAGDRGLSSVECDALADELIALGFRRTVQGEPGAALDGNDIGMDFTVQDEPTAFEKRHAGHEHVGPYCMPHSEPAGAYVRAVWDALGPAITVAFEYEELRAALRAAREVEGENR